jgi:hypothetical protein
VQVWEDLERLARDKAKRKGDQDEGNMLLLAVLAAHLGLKIKSCDFVRK